MLFLSYDDFATAPSLEDLAVHIPLPVARIRNVSELRPSKGEAHWNPAEGVVEWKVPAKEFGASGTAVLRCTIQGIKSDEDENLAAASAMNGFTTTTYDYDDEYDANTDTYRSRPPSNQQRTAATTSTNGTTTTPQQPQRLEKSKDLMPTSATLSLSLKGSLPSGIRVESLQVDTKKSRGLGVEIKPYKGVKYFTVSRRGVEVRC